MFVHPVCDGAASAGPAATTIQKTAVADCIAVDALKAPSFIRLQIAKTQQTGVEEAPTPQARPNSAWSTPWVHLTATVSYWHHTAPNAPAALAGHSHGSLCWCSDPTLVFLVPDRLDYLVKWKSTGKGRSRTFPPSRPTTQIDQG